VPAIPIKGIARLKYLSYWKRKSLKEEEFFCATTRTCLSARNAPAVTAAVPDRISQSVVSHFKGAVKVYLTEWKNLLKSVEISLNWEKEMELKDNRKKKKGFTFISKKPLMNRNGFLLRQSRACLLFQTSEVSRKQPPNPL
jgi:hypothetical protein